MKKNLLVISDGNGVDTDFVKWPTMLKLLTTKSLNIINRSIIGCSNEMMFLQLAQCLKEQPIDYVIVQWSMVSRIDVVVNEFWKKECENDPKYQFNLVDSNHRQWWVTSSSRNRYIQDYHQRYINPWHATQRSQAYMLAAAQLCKNSNIDFVFSLCYDFKFIEPLVDILETLPWAWHSPNSGLSEFRHTSQYINYDTNRSQPHPLISLEWINQVLKPVCKFIDYPKQTYYNLESALLKNV